MRDGLSEGGKEGSIDDQSEGRREGASDSGVSFSLNYRRGSLYIAPLLGLTLQR